MASLTAEPYTVHSTINATLQRKAEAALQEGLAHYEASSGRAHFRGPEANISDAIQKLLLSKQSVAADTPAALPAWQQALQELRLPLSDVHWEPAVVSTGAWRWCDPGRASGWPPDAAERGQAGRPSSILVSTTPFMST